MTGGGQNEQSRQKSSWWYLKCENGEDKIEMIHFMRLE